MARSKSSNARRPRPMSTVAKARSITLGADGDGDVGNLRCGGGDGPGGEEPQQLGTTALNLDPSLWYAPLNYSDEEMSRTEFINAAPFYSLLQDFAPPSMAELFIDSSVEEEMDVVQGWVAARSCSDYLQSVELENYIKLQVRRMWGSNDVGKNIHPKCPTKN